MTRLFAYFVDILLTLSSSLSPLSLSLSFSFILLLIVGDTHDAHGIEEHDGRPAERLRHRGEGRD